MSSEECPKMCNCSSKDSNERTLNEDEKSLRLSRPMAQILVALCQQVLTVLPDLEPEPKQKTKSNEQETQTERVFLVDTEEDKLLPETEVLKKKLKELVDMNVSWQRLNTEREEQIEEMKRKLRLSEIQQHQQIDMKPNTLTSSCCNCTTKMSQIDTSEIATLKDKLSEAESLTKQLESRIELLETTLRDKESTIEMLDMQVQTYREDFECERRDRERAQSRLAEQNRKFETLNRNHQTEIPAYQRSDYLIGRPHQLRSRGVGLYDSDPNLNRRGASYLYDGMEETDGVPDDNNMDLGEKSDSKKSWTYPLAAEDLLHCPNCKKGFTKDEHLRLMDHLEECILV